MFLKCDASFSRTCYYLGALLKLLESPLVCSTLRSVVHVLDSTDNCLSGSDEALIKIHEVEGFGAVNKSFVNGYDHVPGHWRTDPQETSSSERCIQTDRISSRCVSQCERWQIQPHLSEQRSNWSLCSWRTLSLRGPDLNKWLCCIQQEVQGSLQQLWNQRRGGALKLGSVLVWNAGWCESEKELSSLLDRWRRKVCTSCSAFGRKTEKHLKTLQGDLQVKREEDSVAVGCCRSDS